jgi:tetratricopeptide (TPR) repeat protein
MHDRLLLLVVALGLALSPLALTLAHAQGAPAPDLEAPKPPSVPLPRPNPGDQQQAEPNALHDRGAQLEELFAQLAKAPDPGRANAIANAIERLWLHSDSDTIGVLMARSTKAIDEKRTELALRLLDAVVELAPDYAEGWNRRAYVYFLQDRYGSALGDLRRALALEPKHFRALSGLAQILNDYGQKKSALKAYQELLRIHPHASGAKEAVDKLSVEVEGQGI